MARQQTTKVTRRSGLRWIIRPGTDAHGGPNGELGAIAALPFQAGEVFADVGAAVGNYSLRAAKAGMKVVAIEPSAEQRAGLLLNVDANGLGGKVVVVGDAAWSDHERLALRAPSAQAPGMTRVEPDADGEISGKPLDDILKQHRPISLLKIDVEGAEGRALSGATLVLHEDKPVVFVELHWQLCECSHRSAASRGAIVPTHVCGAHVALMALRAAGYSLHEFNRRGGTTHVYAWHHLDSARRWSASRTARYSIATAWNGAYLAAWNVAWQLSHTVRGKPEGRA